MRAWNYGANAENKQLNNYFFYPIEGTQTTRRRHP